VLKYNKAGELIGLFGVGDSQIPHSLALAEDLDLLCVGDRENMRYRRPIISAVYILQSLITQNSLVRKLRDLRLGT